MSEQSDSPFQMSRSRNRPDLRCITDKKYLIHGQFEESPVKLQAVPHLKHIEANLCDIPDQGGGRPGSFDTKAPVRRRKPRLLSCSVDERPRYSDIHFERHERKTMAPSYSNKLLKPRMFDLKKGSFSNKQSAPKEKLLKKLTERRVGTSWNTRLRSLSPFHVSIAKKVQCEGSVFKDQIRNKDEKVQEIEEPIQAWQKYMRELYK